MQRHSNFLTRPVEVEKVYRWSRLQNDDDFKANNFSSTQEILKMGLCELTGITGWLELEARQALSSNGMNHFSYFLYSTNSVGIYTSIIYMYEYSVRVWVMSKRDVPIRFLHSCIVHVHYGVPNTTVCIVISLLNKDVSIWNRRGCLSYHTLLIGVSPHTYMV